MPGRAKLADPPPQTPPDDFDFRANACLRIRIIPLKSNGFRSIIRIDERRTADDRLAGFVKQGS
jgi:hypothetical protein